MNGTIEFKGIVNFEIKILICFSLPQGHPRCRCLSFHSIFNFDIFWSNRCCLSVICRRRRTNFQTESSRFFFQRIFFLFI